MNKIFVSEPFVTGKEYSLVRNAIKQRKISAVNEITQKFENQIKKITSSKYVVACSSGTSALHLALKSLDINEKHEVIVPSITFIATANVVRYVGANPIFFGCDEYFNLDPKILNNFLKENCYVKNNFTFNKRTKKKISALIVVHVWGNSARIYDIVQICKKFNIKIIEDATEGLGSFFIKKNKVDKHLGTYGDLGCLSFNGNKIVTTGNGGAVLTFNKKLEKLCRYYSTQATNNNESYIHNDLGFNYRMSALNAAFGIGQLKKIKFFVSRKKQIHQLYKNFLDKSKNITILNNPSYSLSNNWLNILRFKKNKLKKVCKIFKENNIQIKRVWYPNHLQRHLMKYEKYKVQNVKEYVETSICLPSSISLTRQKIKKICQILKKI